VADESFFSPLSVLVVEVWAESWLLMAKSRANTRAGEKKRAAIEESRL
jgi:hypothetical protein